MLRLDPGVVFRPLGIALSPDGKQVLAAGSPTLLWSINSVDERQPAQWEHQIESWLNPPLDFVSRVRMLSEDPRLIDSLEHVAQRHPDDLRIQSALAALLASRSAERRDWKQAVAEFEKLASISQEPPESWLRTPGLLRLTTALATESRPREALRMLAGGVNRRREDGLADARERTGVGITLASTDGGIHVKNVQIASPAARAGVVPGDFVLKVDEIEIDPESLSRAQEMLEGTAGTIVRLRIRRRGGVEPVEIELERQLYLHDESTGKQLAALRAAVDDQLAKDPQSVAFLELRAVIAAQWLGWNAQVADCSAAIAAISEQHSGTTNADLRRLHGRRGNAYFALHKFQEAIEEFSLAVTEETTDTTLLTNQALAKLAIGLPWNILKPTEMKSAGGAEMSLEEDGSIFVSGVNPEKDAYTLTFKPVPRGVTAVRLEVLPDSRLPHRGSGRSPSNGNFSLSDFSLAIRKGQNPLEDPITIPFGCCDYIPQGSVHAFFAVAGNQLPSWHVFPEVQARHFAVFTVNWPADINTDEDTLIVRIRHGNSQHGLGRFRLAVCNAATAYEWECQHCETLLIHDPRQKLAAANRLLGNQRAIDRQVDRFPESAGRVGEVFASGTLSDDDWQRAIDLYTAGLKARPNDLALRSQRARAYESLRNWESAAADWKIAAERNPNGLRWIVEFVRRLTAEREFGVAETQRQLARSLLESALREDPENYSAMTDLAQLLLETAKPEWVVLRPTKMTSTGGATLSRLADDSILASGETPPTDDYRIVYSVPSAMSLAAVRLEALNHASLPAFGPGRGRLGPLFRSVFIQTGMYATVTHPDQSGRVMNLQFADVAAAPQNSIAPELSEGLWTNVGSPGRPREAFWSTSSHVVLKDSSHLELQLFGLPSTAFRAEVNHGRFRVSVTGDPALLDHERKRFASMRIENGVVRLAAAYAVQSEISHAADWAGRGLDGAKSNDAKMSLLEPLLDFDELLVELNRRRPDDLAVRVALTRSLSRKGTALAAQKQSAAAIDKLLEARNQLTQLLADHPEPQWTVLEPVETSSQEGATLTPLSDRSILASGAIPDNDIYTVETAPLAGPISAIRLEVLTDASLPQNGPGREPINGNLHLSDFRVQLLAESPTAGATAVAMDSAVADYESSALPVSGAIDDNPISGWSFDPKSGVSHLAVFQLAKPLDDLSNHRLQFALSFRNPAWRRFAIGRFRLSATSDPGGFAMASQRLKLSGMSRC
ncbi:MAG: PDZ domain-containing protein [Planctomycetota bacterium]|nr:PDZ domain-containing protein [Planctomycetota bacterium]